MDNTVTYVDMAADKPNPYVLFTSTSHLTAVERPSSEDDDKKQLIHNINPIHFPSNKRIVCGMFNLSNRISGTEGAIEAEHSATERALPVYLSALQAQNRS